eukprot:9069761-Pyramimonas_sp.AAC.1
MERESCCIWPIVARCCRRSVARPRRRAMRGRGAPLATRQGGKTNRFPRLSCSAPGALSGAFGAVLGPSWGP